MKKIIRLTERDLTRIVRRVIIEQQTPCDIEWKKLETFYTESYNKNRPKNLLPCHFLFYEGDEKTKMFGKMVDMDGSVEYQKSKNKNELKNCLIDKLISWCESRKQT
jgi:hypothetical protein